MYIIQRKQHETVQVDQQKLTVILTLQLQKNSLRVLLLVIYEREPQVPPGISPALDTVRRHTEMFLYAPQRRTNRLKR